MQPVPPNPVMASVAAPAPAPQKPTAGGCSACGSAGCAQCTPGKAKQVGETVRDSRLLSEHERKAFDPVKRQTGQAGRPPLANPFARPGATVLSGDINQALAEIPEPVLADRTRLDAAIRAYRANW